MTSLYDILKANRLGMDSDPWVAILGEAWKASEEDFKEYTGLVPYTFIANGQPLLDWYIKGNMQQTGTPTPDNPITPQETGERTGNLWDGISYNAYVTFTGEYISPDNTTLLIIFKCEPNTTYTIKSLSPHSSASKWRIAVFVQLPTNGSIGTVIVNDDSLDQSTITTLTDSKYVVVYYKYSNSPQPNTFMVNEGSTPLPYEPYGYKIPISSANTTTPVYFGEVQTTRKIRKLVLTGEEDWDKGTYAFYSVITGIATYKPVLCSHYQYYGGVSSSAPIDSISTGSGGGSAIWIRTQNHGDTTVEQWKSYLAAQYSNGTPVTVWYVLATPETAVVSEPLRKIGDYADMLTATQAGVEIPTDRGRNTIDIDTTLKPSEFYMKWKER